MKISSLTVKNFKAIEYLHLGDLGDMVVIAGPNGCGKSTVFEAIKLLKSTYGHYTSNNELQQFFGEYQIQLKRNPRFELLLRDRTQPMELEWVLILNDEEKSYLSANARAWVRRLLIRDEVSADGTAVLPPQMSLAEQERLERKNSPEIDSLTEELKSLLKEPSLVGGVFVTSDQQVKFLQNLAIQMICSTYDPPSLGVFDFHGPQRTYSRENLDSLRLSSSTHELSSSALYNTSAKYQNIKMQLANSYLVELIGEKAGTGGSLGLPDLTKTIQSLFKQFFPSKEFVGVVPTPEGKLEFPVRMSDGSCHDINELSSGEKEIVFGYVRLRNSEIQNSVLMFDEPELHLNPKLIEGLPEFYAENFGRAFGNQIWMVTHSDALIRGSLRQPSFSVFHLMEASVGEGVNQAHRVLAEEDSVDILMMELIGDAAVYRPRNPVVLIEGKESGSDVQLIGDLFPEYLAKANFVAAGDKQSVRRIHQALLKVEDLVRVKVFSVVDLDTEPYEDDSVSQLSWDVYHIENYLLDNEIIYEVLRSLNVKHELSLSDMDSYLKNCASKTQHNLVRHRIWKHLDSFLKPLNVKNPDLNDSDFAEKMHQRLASDLNQLRAKLDDDLSIESIANTRSRVESEVLKELDSGKWRQSFKGRDILKLVAKDIQIQYPHLRSLIISRMRERDFKPIGMKRILDACLEID